MYVNIKNCVHIVRENRINIHFSYDSIVLVCDYHKCIRTIGINCADSDIAYAQINDRHNCKRISAAVILS